MMGLESIVVPPGHRLVRISDEPALWEPADEMCGASWPEFMLHDPVADRCWDRLRDDWPGFQLVLVDEAGGIAAASQAAPLLWDGTDDGLPDGWDAQFEQSVARSRVAAHAKHARGDPDLRRQRPARSGAERADRSRRCGDRGPGRFRCADRLRPAHREEPLPAAPDRGAMRPGCVPTACRSTRGCGFMPGPAQGSFGVPHDR